MARRILGGLVPAVFLAFSAAACASVEPPRPTYRASLPAPAETPAAVRASTPVPNPPEQRGSGGYATPSAVAKALGVYKVGKPYKVAGVWYVPAEQPDYDAVGTASWYGDAFHGKPTANGEAFDMHMASAAHATLPLPSIVEVTNLENDRSIQVRVNDRGPFKPGRIIDVSRQAADQLGFVRQGVAKVRVRYVGRAPLDPFLPTPPAGDGPAKPVLIAALNPKVEARITARAEARQEASLAAVAEVRPARKPKLKPEPRPEPRPEPELAPTAEPAPVILAAALPNFAVQAGSFANKGNAERAAKALGGIAPAQVREQERDGSILYRVLVGGWTVKDGAAEVLAAVAQAGFPDAKVVTGS